MPPSGDFFIFPALFQCVKVRCLLDSSKIGRFFHQLGELEYECFRLAGALVADENVRVALLETFAAGKYPHVSHFRFRLLVLGTRCLHKHHS